MKHVICLKMLSGWEAVLNPLKQRYPTHFHNHWFRISYKSMRVFDLFIFILEHMFEVTSIELCALLEQQHKIVHYILTKEWL